MKKDRFIFKLLAETRIYFVVIVVFAALSLQYKNYVYAAVELSFLAAMIVYHIFSSKKKREEMTLVEVHQKVSGPI